MRPEELVRQLWSTHRGMLITIALLLLGNLVMYVFLEQYLVPKVATQENSYIQRQAEVRQLLRSKGAADDSPEQLYALASKDLASFHEMIPEYLEFTGLIEDLLVLSSRAGLNITQVGYRPKELAERALLRYELNFSIKGRYEQVKKFIHSLEQSQRLLVIRQIGLQGTEEGEVNLRLSLETFFRAEKLAS